MSEDQESRSMSWRVVEHDGELLVYLFEAAEGDAPRRWTCLHLSDGEFFVSRRAGAARQGPAAMKMVAELKGPPIACSEEAAELPTQVAQEMGMYDEPLQRAGDFWSPIEVRLVAGAARAFGEWAGAGELRTMLDDMWVTLGDEQEYEVRRILAGNLDPQVATISSPDLFDAEVMGEEDVLLAVGRDGHQLVGLRWAPLRICRFGPVDVAGLEPTPDLDAIQIKDRGQVVMLGDFEFSGLLL